MKKNLIIRIGLSLITTMLLILGIYTLAIDSTDVAFQYETNNIGNTAVVGEITAETCVKQEVEGSEEFYGVRVLFATYGNINISSTYQFQLVTEGGEVLYEEIVNASTLDDNAYYYVALDEPMDLSGNLVTLVVTSSDAVPGNAITIWRSSEDQYEQGQLRVNDEIIEGDIVFDNITNVTVDSNADLLIYRIATYLLVYAFIMLNVWVPLKKLYDFIFKYRLLIAIAAFLILVVNEIHYSSIDMYDEYIQPTLESGYDEPIWGTARAIRSDEWLVSTPRRLTTTFAGTGETNYIPMALELRNLTSTGLQEGWSALAEPYEWGYYIGDAETGISWYWNFIYIFAFYFSFEMCLILSKGKKMLSVLGGTLIGCAPIFFWWSGTIWLMAGQGAIVCLHYALNAEKKYMKCFFGIWTAIFASCFVSVLYPAWQVPAGYMFLILLVMVFIYAWEKIKKYDKWDWLIIVACVAFMVSILVSYLLTYSEYMVAISNTVYPGARVGLGGGYLSKLGNYIGAWMFSIKEIVNPCEHSIFFNLFPLPILLGGYYMIKEKKWDGLIGALIVLSLFYTVYCAVEIPEWLAKITLMSNSTGKRTADILSLLQSYLFIAAAGRVQEEKKFKRVPAFVAIFVCVLGAAYMFEKTMPYYFNKYQLIAIVLVITLCMVPWIARVTKIEKISALVVVCTVTIVTGFMVNPVMKGLDTIYTKPVANEIMSIVKEDSTAKWIVTDSTVASGLAISCGAPTINSTNFIPNYDLWEILDEDGEYEKYWNRYAHMNITLTEDETSVILNSTDALTLVLSYDDLEKIDVSYIYTLHELDSSEHVELEEIYNEAGSYIYKVNYN